MKGGILGVDNTPTTSLASGMWRLGEVFKYRDNETWPGSVTEQLIEEMSTVNGSYTLSASYPLLGQCFACDLSADLSKASFYLTQSATSGTIVAKLYTISGTYGSTAVPATLLATSDTVNATNIPSGGGWVDFTFSGAAQYSLSNGTNYYIVLDASGGGYATYHKDTASVYGGNYAYWNGSGFTAGTTGDYTFKVYGLA